MAYNSKELKDYLCLACDLTDYDEIIRLVDELHDIVGYFKFNSAFITFGARLIQDVQARGGKIFLDLKFHDIPNTLRMYAHNCIVLGIDMFTVHIAAGKEALEQAVQTLRESEAATGKSPKIIGITVMTSTSQAMMNEELHVPFTIGEQVVHLGTLAMQAGLDGIVCAASDLETVRQHMPHGCLYLTPGIRPAQAKNDDQKRVMTPAAAIRAGSSMLVMGRAIYQAQNRRGVAENILQEIQSIVASNPQ